MIQVRALSSADAGLWRSVRLEGIRFFPEAFILSEEEAIALPENADARMLDKGGRIAVFDDDEPVGIAALGRHSFARCQHRGSLGPFYVSPSVQGSGAAGMLMHAMIDDAKTHGIWQLELFVATGNSRAIRFYESHGFKQQGVLPNAVILANELQDDLFYTLDLRNQESLVTHKA